MQNKKSSRMRQLTMLALFAALVVLLGLTPLGLIPLGFINVTILCVPVIAGTLLLGWRSGLLLGLCFGGVSLFAAMTRPSTLVGTLLGASPFLVVVMSLLPRLLVPLVSWLVYQLAGRRLNSHVATAVAAACGSLTNTVFYLGLMLLFYVMCGIDTSGVLALIGGIGLIAGGCEAVAAALLVTPILAALKKIRRS